MIGCRHSSQQLDNTVSSQSLAEADTRPCCLRCTFLVPRGHEDPPSVAPSGYTGSKLSETVSATNGDVLDPEEEDWKPHGKPRANLSQTTFRSRRFRNSHTSSSNHIARMSEQDLSFHGHVVDVSGGVGQTWVSRLDLMYFSHTPRDSCWIKMRGPALAFKHQVADSRERNVCTSQEWTRRKCGVASKTNFQHAVHPNVRQLPSVARLCMFVKCVRHSSTFLAEKRKAGRIAAGHRVFGIPVLDTFNEQCAWYVTPPARISRTLPLGGRIYWSVNNETHASSHSSSHAAQQRMGLSATCGPLDMVQPHGSHSVVCASDFGFFWLAFASRQCLCVCASPCWLCSRFLRTTQTTHSFGTVLVVHAQASCNYLASRKPSGWCIQEPRKPYVAVRELCFLRKTYNMIFSPLFLASSQIDGVYVHSLLVDNYIFHERLALQACIIVVQAALQIIGFSGMRYANVHMTKSHMTSVVWWSGVGFYLLSLLVYLGLLAIAPLSWSDRRQLRSKSNFQLCELFPAGWGFQPTGRSQDRVWGLPRPHHATWGDLFRLSPHPTQQCMRVVVVSAV